MTQARSRLRAVDDAGHRAYWLGQIDLLEGLVSAVEEDLEEMGCKRCLVCNRLMLGERGRSKMLCGRKCQNKYYRAVSPIAYQAAPNTQLRSERLLDIKRRLKEREKSTRKRSALLSKPKPYKS